MNIGKLDKKITLNNRSSAPNTLGDVVDSYTPAATVWAEVRFLKGRELSEAQQMVAEVDTKFTIRYSSQVNSVDAKCQISYNGKNYDVLDVIPIPGGRPEKLELMAKRRAD